MPPPLGGTVPGDPVAPAPAARLWLPVLPGREGRARARRATRAGTGLSRAHRSTLATPGAPLSPPPAKQSVSSMGPPRRGARGTPSLSFGRVTLCIAAMMLVLLR